jgi:hypothetical protein
MPNCRHVRGLSGGELARLNVGTGRAEAPAPAVPRLAPPPGHRGGGNGGISCDLCSPGRPRLQLEP